MNKLARAVTKCTTACGKRFARLIAHIHHTCEYRQYCYVGSTAQQCRLGLFQDSDFAGDLEDSQVNIRRNSVHFRKPHVCAKKLDVQETDFSSTVVQKLKYYFNRCRFTHGGDSRSRSLGFGFRSFPFFPKPTQQHQRSSTRSNPGTFRRHSL